MILADDVYGSKYLRTLAYTTPLIEMLRPTHLSSLLATLYHLVDP